MRTKYITILSFSLFAINFKLLYSEGVRIVYYKQAKILKGTTSPEKLVRPARVELTTYSLEGSCSIH